MKVAIIGGTGFVGSYLVDNLLAAGHTPRLLVRPGSEGKVSQPDQCEQVTGDIGDDRALQETLSDSDAVIYNIGILREFPAQGITFEDMHFRHAARTIATCEEHGPQRFLMMSANGVKAGGTRYQDSKYRADAALAESSLDWTIFRPSVIFGDPRGRMEFCTQLDRDMIRPPIPAPLFYNGLLPTDAGQFRMSPVHVEDVAAAFVRALDRAETIGQTYTLCGPEALTWKDIIRTIAAADGRDKLMLPAPAGLVRAAASLLDTQAWFPITREQVDMLMEGNTCSEMEAFRLLDIQPTAFTPDSLGYLRQP